MLDASHYLKPVRDPVRRVYEVVEETSSVPSFCETEGIAKLELDEETLTLEGSSLTNQAIAKLSEELEQEEYLSHVNLHFTRVEDEAEKGRSFKVTARYGAGASMTRERERIEAAIETGKAGPGTWNEPGDWSVNAESEIVRKEAVLLELRKGLAEAGEVAPVLKATATAFKSAGLDAWEFRPLADRAEADFADAPVDVRLRGGLAALKTYLKEVSAMDKLVMLDPFSVVSYGRN